MVKLEDEALNLEAGVEQKPVLFPSLNMKRLRLQCQLLRFSSSALAYRRRKCHQVEAPLSALQVLPNLPSQRRYYFASGLAPQLLEPAVPIHLELSYPALAALPLPGLLKLFLGQ